MQKRNQTPEVMAVLHLILSVCTWGTLLLLREVMVETAQGLLILAQGCGVAPARIQPGSRCHSTAELSDGISVVYLISICNSGCCDMFGIGLEYAYTSRYGCFGGAATRLDFSDLRKFNKIFIRSLQP